MRGRARRAARRRPARSSAPASSRRRSTSSTTSGPQPDPLGRREPVRSEPDHDHRGDPPATPHAPAQVRGQPHSGIEMPARVALQAAPERGAPEPATADEQGRRAGAIVPDAGVAADGNGHRPSRGHAENLATSPQVVDGENGEERLHLHVLAGAIDALAQRQRHRVDARAAADHVGHAVHGVEHVRALAPVEHVEARPAVHRVVAPLAEHDVGAHAADQCVAAVAALEPIVAEAHLRAGWQRRCRSGRRSPSLPRRPPPPRGRRPRPRRAR